jgi:DNA-binding PadR family transcriptional regulator
VASLPLPRLSDKERLILELLVEHGDLYGLQLVAASRRRLKRGSVYVTLSRMTQKGFVESEPGPRAPSDTGLPRPLYRPTALGKRVLRAWATLARELAWNHETA